MKNRAGIASKTERLGQQINELRNELLENDAPFTAGLVRSAEEALLIVLTALNDVSGVPEGEL